MSERTVIAYFEVDEDCAFDGFGDGPVPYLEHEAVCLEKSGIFLTGAAIADEDADDPKEAYLVYLARFCFEHFGVYVLVRRVGRNLALKLLCSEDL